MALKKEGTLISDLVREIPARQFLFKEGDVAKAAFLILKGTVKLIRETASNSYTVASFGKGDILGEKALLQKSHYRHSLSAETVTPTSALEFAFENTQGIETQIPDLTSRLLSAACARLDAANELIKILHTDNPAERFILYLLHFTRCNKKGFPDISEIPLHPNEICFSTKIDLDCIEKCFRFLIDKKVVVKKENVYFVVDEKGLSQTPPALNSYLSK